MSKDQEKTAVRVAKVPEAEFEAAVESDNPPTVTELAERGTTPQPKPEVPAKFAEATKVLGMLRAWASRDVRRAHRADIRSDPKIENPSTSAELAIIG